MKKAGVLFLLILLCASWTAGRKAEKPAQRPGEDIELLKMAFAATAAAPAGAEISGWAVLAPTYYSPREAEAAVESMARIFELNRNEYTILLRSTGHYGYALMDCDLSDSVSLRVQVQSLDTETIASIEIKQTHHRELELRYRQLKQALLALNPEEDVKITSCLEGTLNARLRNSERLNLAYSAFSAVEAIFQEGIDASGLAVWSGWSPMFAQVMNTGNKEVNFGIAFRYESGSRKTIVRVATPVLPGSY
jgi:hypothetical protein